MNLRQLSTGAMINVSGFWLSNSAVRALLDGHPLSAAMALQLKVAHDMLTSLEQRRLANEAAILRLTGELKELDGEHDRKVRALYYFITGLMSATDDADLREWLSELRARLLPGGLATVQLAYADEAGWTRSVSAALKPGERARMATITVGAHTLDELFQDWLGAGTALGERLLERAQIQASHAPDGPATAELHRRRVRSTWIRTVHALINSLDVMELDEADLLKVLAPLHKSIELAERTADDAEGEDSVEGEDGADSEPEPEPEPEPELELEPEPEAEPGSEPEAGADPSVASA